MHSEPELPVHSETLAQPDDCTGCRRERGIPVGVERRSYQRRADPASNVWCDSSEAPAVAQLRLRHEERRGPELLIRLGEGSAEFEGQVRRQVVRGADRECRRVAGPREIVIESYQRGREIAP